MTHIKQEPLEVRPVQQKAGGPHNPDRPATALQVARRFQQGTSGNPGGRPKGFQREIKARFGKNGEALADFAAAVLEGTATCTITEVVMVKDSEGATYPQEVTTEVGPTLRDKIEILKIAAAYGWGKPAQSIEISGPEGGPIQTRAVDVDRLGLQDLMHLEALLEKGAPALAEDVVEGEVLNEATEHQR